METAKARGRAQAEADRLTRRKADAQASAFALSVGRQKLKNGDRPGAIAQFREALRLADDNADAHYALAQALKQAGAVAEARKHFELAKKLSPHATGGRVGQVMRFFAGDLRLASVVLAAAVLAPPGISRPTRR